jgi:hypothetical protein
MNVDAIVLALIAIADLALIVHLRRRRNRRLRQERMMGSLRIALLVGQASWPARLVP